MPEGQAGSRQMGIHSDAMLPGLKKLVSVIHDQGGAVAVHLSMPVKKGSARKSVLPSGAFRPHRSRRYPFFSNGRQGYRPHSAGLWRDVFPETTF
ncbi:MAG: hypothetical protein WC124_03870 [Desulfoplanes sp.]